MKKGIRPKDINEHPIDSVPTLHQAMASVQTSTSLHRCIFVVEAPQVSLGRWINDAPGPKKCVQLNVLLHEGFVGEMTSWDVGGALDIKSQIDVIVVYNAPPPHEVEEGTVQCKYHYTSGGGYIGRSGAGWDYLLSETAKGGVDISRPNSPNIPRVNLGEGRLMVRDTLEGRHKPGPTPWAPSWR